MSDHIENDEPEVDETGVERDDEEVGRAPQPGDPPTPPESPPFDSTLPRERDEQ